VAKVIEYMEELKIRGNKHFYKDLNKDRDDVIVLIHGHPFDSSMWDYQVEALKDFRLIIPDLKGYGKTDYRFEKIYIEEQALDLAILLDALQIDKVNLIGLSMGGQIAVEFCRLFPARASSLILCDGNPGAEDAISYTNRLKLAERIDAIGMTEYTKQEIHKYLSLSTIENNPAVYKHLYRMMTNTPKEGVIASHKGRAERRDNYGYLRQIPCRVLVVVGEDDFFTPVEEMREIAALIPDSEFEIISNSGHMPNMEQPESFNSIITAFYTRYAGFTRF
jgi:pimeloyl-ACP methyl ester carboxylesterase